MNWHAEKKEDVLEEFRTSKDGLTEEEATKRIIVYKKNVIEDNYKLKPLKTFFKQFKSFIVYVLLGASAISFILDNFLDSAVILSIVLLNATLGFVQEYKAEKSILNLKKLLIPKTKVIRGGKIKIISSEDLVPGDIVVFEQGDKVNADCRIIELENLEVNEAILTGESFPVEKTANLLIEKTILAERKNMLYTGTSVVLGSCKAVVVATGMKSEFGKIAKTLQEIELPETPMQKKLNKFVMKISIVITLLAITIFSLGTFFGREKIEMFLMAVTLAISAIPEGFPAIITISLAIASKNMAIHNVIVRRLPAAETLGSVSVICSDKTGTITEEKMFVKKLYSNNKFYEKEDGKILLKDKSIEIHQDKNLYQLIKASVLCNNARFEKTEKLDGKITEKYDIIGDPTESSFVLSALDLGINKKILSENEPRIREISFTSGRKMMSIIRKSDRGKIIYSKGASQAILKKCSFEMLNGEIIKLTDERKKELLKISEKMESEALRVLGFAFKNVVGDSEEEGLIFVGFIGIQDSPRKEVKDAIKICLNAGIKIKMITGDSAITAREIGRQVGIDGEIMTGDDLDKITDADLRKKIDEIHIFARISPSQKLRIVRILKKNGEQVAITGDGINDVLALKQADIGIAMGERGTDVAREVSDMVLIDDNFASIAKAVEEGRIVFNNTKKITKLLISINFSEIALVATSVVAKLPLPLLPLQLLWMNLVTDSLPAISLIKEKGDKDIMKRKPEDEKNLLSGIKTFIIFASILIFASELGIFLFALSKNYTIEVVRTMVLTSDIIYELSFVYVCRSDKSLKEIGFFSNKYLNGAVIISLAMHLAVLYTPLSSVFGLGTLGINEWLIILPFGLSGLIIFESYKIIRDKLNAHTRN